MEEVDSLRPASHETESIEYVEFRSGNQLVAWEEVGTGLREVIPGKRANQGNQSKNGTLDSSTKSIICQLYEITFSHF